MSRGKQEQTKLKESVKVAVRETAAYKVAARILQDAEIKAHEKKPLLESLREHIGKAIDRIDPLETAVLIAGTYAIHETILGTETLLLSINKTLATRAVVAVGLLNPIAGLLLTQLPVFKTEQDLNKQMQDIKAPDSVMLWIISLLVAFILIRHGSEIFKAGITGITQIVGFLGFAV